MSHSFILNVDGQKIEEQLLGLDSHDISSGSPYDDACFRGFARTRERESESAMVASLPSRFGSMQKLLLSWGAQRLRHRSSRRPSLLG